MHGNSLSARLLVCPGAVLFALGLVGDGCIGIFFLKTSDIRLLLLHGPLVFIWVLGIACITRRDMNGGTAFLVSASIVAPLILGLFTFPGFGPVTYSLALVLTRFLHHQVAEGAMDDPEQSLGTMTQSLKKSRPLDLAIEPLVDVLHDVDMEMRRTAITVLSRSATPGAIQLLRQLLSDPQLEIRSDASIALTRIDDELSGNLNAALEQCTVAPTDTRCLLNLVQQYCAYADSKLLDEINERVYLEKARDLLEQVIDQGHRDAEQVMLLARIRQRLGEMTRALRDVDVAHQLAPQAPEAYMLAMELAFRLHSWDQLIALAREAIGVLPGDAERQTSLRWWAMLPTGR
jgi:HEAT repeats